MMVKLLLERGADPMLTEKHGVTLLFADLASQQYELVELMKEYIPSKQDLQNIDPHA